MPQSAVCEGVYEITANVKPYRLGCVITNVAVIEVIKGKGRRSGTSSHLMAPRILTIALSDFNILRLLATKLRTTMVISHIFACEIEEDQPMCHESCLECLKAEPR